MTTEKQWIDEHAEFVKEFTAKITKFRKSCKSLAELEKFMEDHVHEFIKWSFGHASKHKPKKEVWHVKFERMKWEDEASNSHHCPIGKKYVTNWGCEDDCPKGYPGWTGYLKSTFENEQDGYPNPNEGNLSGICIGTGGPAHGWGVTLFKADWPKLVI
jgi:hypothetical protein